MTADISLPASEHLIAAHSNLQIYVQLINENIGHAVGSWLSDREWNSPTIHWQREVPLYPGSYSLRVFALDPASNRIATRAFSFTADPFGGSRVIRLSPTVISNRCLRDEEIEGRKNLFDPLLFDGCLLAPTATGTFSLRDKPTVLVRFYAHEKNLESTTFKKWKAFASVGDGPLIPLTITAGAVRGFIASGQLDLANLNLKPGSYIVTVGFDIGEKEPVFALPANSPLLLELRSAPQDEQHIRHYLPTLSSSILSSQIPSLAGGRPLRNLALIAAIFVATAACAQQKPAYLMDGLSTLHHPVSTLNAEAQKFFDQGLVSSTLSTTKKPPAPSTAPPSSIPNSPWPGGESPSPSDPTTISPSTPSAKSSPSKPQQSARPQLHLHAHRTGLHRRNVQRFSGDPKPDYHQLDINYSKAMADLTHRYPDDLDAATLYADSLMNLRPWQLWNHDGTPADGTPEIVSTLEGVLRRDPNHIGAMHLYIHAVEASPNPERALPYADRIPTLAPAAGHLVHMPAHIYERTGNFDGARAQNVAAAKADEAYAASTGSQGMYMMMYYSHNLHFGAVSASMQGRCAEAKSQADRLAGNLRPMAGDKEMSAMIEPFLGMQYAMAVRCGRWDDMLATSDPQAHTSALKAFGSTVRGLALTARGKLDEAEIAPQTARRNRSRNSKR